MFPRNVPYRGTKKAALPLREDGGKIRRMQTFLPETGLAGKAIRRGIEFIAELVGKTESGHASGGKHHRLACVTIAAQAATLVMSMSSST